MSESILPPNASVAERAMEAAIRAVDPDLTTVGTLMNPETCPVELLGWLAWSMSVDRWRDDWSEATKRRIIRTAIEVHRLKGTFGAVRRAVEAAGLGAVQIVEADSPNVRDGSFRRDGTKTRATTDHWAEYRVVANQPMTVDQADLLRDILSDVQPARSRLRGIDYQQAAWRRNGVARRDGSITRGFTA